MPIKPGELDSLFNKFRQLKALIIGDVMIDAYLHGKVERISPEAPVPVVALQKRNSFLGGAANVARNIRSLGATPMLCSVTGDDKQADEFMQLLREAGIDGSGIVRSSKRITTTKFRIIGNRTQMLRIDEEMDTDLYDDEVEALLAAVQKRIASARPDVIILQDYDKGVLTPASISTILTMANAAGIPVAADPKKKNFSAYKGVMLFKPNLKELRDGLKMNMDPSCPGDLAMAATRLHDDQQVVNVMITLSEHGIFVSHHDGKDATFQILPAHVRNISDVSGAGDTVISIASLCLAAGASIETTASLANLGGGLVCEYPGVVPVDAGRLRTEAGSIT